MSTDTNQAADAYELVGEFVSIFQRGARWHVNYQHGGRQVRKSLKTTSKKEARRRALQIEREILAGEHQHQRQAPLIEEVVELYLAHVKAEGRSANTLSKYRFCFDILLEVAKRRRAKRISQLGVAVVDAFRADRVAGNEERKAAKPKTIHNDTVTIRQLVNFALKRGLIQDDPLHALQIKKPKRTLQPCWPRDQVEWILAEASPPHQAPLTFLADTGARVGECKWLTWEDVDFERGLILIRPKDGWKPKSGDERAVPMTERLEGLLKEMPRHGLWVFTARVTRQHPEPGRQLSERRLLQYLKRLLKRLGLPGHLHTFRHSFISFAALRGTPERVLRKWIGHVDQQVLDWYFHLTDSQSHEAMRRLSQAGAPTDHGANDPAGRATSDAGPGAETDGDSAQIQHSREDDENVASAK